MRARTKISRLDTFTFNHYRWVHASRMMLAFLIMLAITQWTNIPESTWPLITLVVVMGPISYWGNVLPRAIQRVLGTCLGAASGIIALYFETFSIPLFMIWCACVMFACGYLALGKRPYAGLLIGITLSVVLGAPKGDFATALWRSGDVILGSAFALLCCSVFPQKAFTHWRLKVSGILLELGKMHHTMMSLNMLDRPNTQEKQKALLDQMIKARGLISASAAETRLNTSLLGSIQRGLGNTLHTIDRLSVTYWNDRNSHFTLLNSQALKESHQAIEDTFAQLATMLQTGKSDGSEWQFDNLNEVIDELKELASQHDVQSEASLYGYVWLNLQLLEELSLLRRTISLSLNLACKKKR
ncbi:MAG: FUSC family protein [Vibrio sp.]